MSNKFRLDTIGAMNATALYNLLERLASHLRSQARRGDTGLQPVQIDALHYLSRCNRYSNTPLGVTDFLGLTKGTVSQSLKVLESRGLIEKRADAHDKRVVHLLVTPAGRELLDGAIPPVELEQAMSALAAPLQQQLLGDLSTLLLALQRTNGMKSFAQCKSCRFNRRLEDGRFACGLTGEPLSEEEVELICREHQYPEGAGSSS
ncbi:MarR family winged helix-turn-helix transcriptional regulator [Gallaecimonas sp. GXIMD4217]|uniref:MarR family winged helix-turn-helix transcriptional regulator n=1 Tax=Gallaecimonas sp. GXIMD4217 TaxID=3131927 RepID=UPI00311B059A